MLVFVEGEMKIDFKDNSLRNWYVVNDGVMGGLSKGYISETETGVRFQGVVSLENNGGFSSFRGPTQRYDLSDYNEVTIRYRSTGVKVAFQLSVDQRFYYPNFKIKLPNSEEWSTKTFALDEVRQYRLGYPTGGYLSQASKGDIIRLGFITDEKRAGDFEFEVDYVVFR